MATTYTYNLDATPNNKANPGRLEKEIQASPDITIALDPLGIQLEGSTILIHFKVELEPAQKAALDEIIANHSGEPLTPTSNLPVKKQPSITVSTYPPRVDRFNKVSHRWTDPTTWYTCAALVEGEALGHAGDYKTYNVSQVNLIDMTHGKQWKEDSILSPEGTSYQPRVYVDGDLKTETLAQYGENQDPSFKRDYTIDYAAGVVHFHEALTAGQAVTIDYYHATTSDFYIQPEEGRQIDLSRVEVQFTQDTSIRDTIHFFIEGYAAVFAPDAVEQGLLQPTDRVELGAPATYKSFYDYCNEANGAYATIPYTTNANPTWRDSTSPVLTFPWDYQAVVRLRADQGLRIKVKLDTDTPFDGTFCTASFYGFEDGLDG